MSFTDFDERSDGIRNDCSIGIKHQVSQHLHEARAFSPSGIRRVDFCDADRCCLAHVGISIFECVSEGICEGFCYDWERDVGHCADGECADERVVVCAILRTRLVSSCLREGIVNDAYLEEARNDQLNLIGF